MHTCPAQHHLHHTVSDTKTVNCNTVRSFSTHGQLSAAQGSSITVVRPDIRASLGVQACVTAAPRDGRWEGRIESGLGEGVRYRGEAAGAVVCRQGGACVSCQGGGPRTVTVRRTARRTPLPPHVLLASARASPPHTRVWFSPLNPLWFVSQGFLNPAGRHNATELLPSVRPEFAPQGYASRGLGQSVDNPPTKSFLHVDQAGAYNLMAASSPYDSYAEWLCISGVHTELVDRVLLEAASSAGVPQRRVCDKDAWLTPALVARLRELGAWPAVNNVLATPDLHSDSRGGVCVRLGVVVYVFRQLPGEGVMMPGNMIHQVAHWGVRRMKKLRIVIIGFGTARQKMVLERWTNRAAIYRCVEGFWICPAFHTRFLSRSAKP